MKILKFKGKMRLRYKILILIVILIVASILGITIAYMVNENVRNWININILHKEVTEDDVATIEIDSDKTQYFYAYDKYITILSNGTLEIYNSYASKVTEIDVGISNPIFAGQGSNLLIAENGGQKLCVVSDGKIQWENRVEGNIDKISINKNGEVAVITQGTTYKSVIVIFNKSGKEQFKTYLASTIAVGADISVDGKYLAIAEVNIGGALVESSVKIIEIEKASNGDTTNSVVYKYNADSNKVITAIKYQEKGQLVCMYDDSIHIIENGNESTFIEFDKETQVADINLKSYTVRTEETSNGLFSSKTDIILTNIITNAENTYTIESVIKSLTAREQAVAINLGTEVHIVNINGWMEKKYTSNQEIKDVVLGSSIAGIIYRDRIKIITF